MFETHYSTTVARLDLTAPVVMGILNITPDSFYDRCVSVDQAIIRAKQMVQEGVHMIDIGGESTRPYAEPVSEQEELDRVIPVIEKLSQTVSVPLSVDTSRPAVMSAAVAAGACLINDVRALSVPGAIEAVRRLEVPVCLMHMQQTPQTMQQSPVYKNVVAEVLAFLQARIAQCVQEGICREQLIVDPGFGFGKSLAHNVTLLRKLKTFSRLGCPLLIGLSRKSMIGSLLKDAPLSDRLYGSLAAAILAVSEGAHIIRVHDVKATVDALSVAHQILHRDFIEQ